MPLLLLTTAYIPPPNPVSTDASIQPQRRSLSVGVIIGVVFGGLLLVVLVLLFLVLFRRWKQPKDQFTPSPGFDPDSLWINRRLVSTSSLTDCSDDNLTLFQLILNICASIYQCNVPFSPDEEGKEQNLSL